jgi:hypothetical protein
LRRYRNVRGNHPVEAAARPRLSEDLIAGGLGLGVFVLGLLSLSGADALGWLVTTSLWTKSGLGVGGLSITKRAAV